MELFDKKFVYFMWDDELRGKECFYDDNIDGLRKSVDENDTDFKGCLEPNTSDYPFRPILRGKTCCSWRFAYYDPNYECKVAYSEGKKIQHRRKGEKDWYESTPAWDPRYEYRIKPVKYYVGIGINKTLTWHSDTMAYKHVYASFDSTQDADKWIYEHKKFVPVMRAFEKGLPIEYKYSGGDWAEASTPSWDLRLRYRVKPVYNSLANKPRGKCYTCRHKDKEFREEPCSKCFDSSRWEPKKRRMTNRELAKWLAEGNGQKIDDSNKFAYTAYAYKDDDNAPCRKDVMIRAWNETEWHEPEVEQ